MLKADTCQSKSLLAHKLICAYATTMVGGNSIVLDNLHGWKAFFDLYAYLALTIVLYTHALFINIRTYQHLCFLAHFWLIFLIGKHITDTQ